MKSAYETIGVFDNPIQAHVVKAKLESEGIASYIRGEHTIGVNPLYSHILGGVRLEVEAEDAPQARRILERDESDMDPEPESESEES